MYCIHTFTYHLCRNLSVYMCVCLGRQALLKHLVLGGKHRCVKYKTNRRYVCSPCNKESKNDRNLNINISRKYII